MRLVHLNCDRGIHPDRAKGAAVHLRAMREAFAELGAEVCPIDEPDFDRSLEMLQAAHAGGGLDFIYERLALGSAVGERFARAEGVPHVIEVNAPLDEEEHAYRASSGLSVDLDSIKATLSGAQLVLCVSSACADWAIRRGAASERVVVAGNGVDARRFHPGRRAEAHAELAIPEGAFVIGFHGRLRPWHGFDRLVRAAGVLYERGVPVHLLMVGKGDYAEQAGSVLPAESWTHIEWVDHDEVGRLVARFDVLPLSYDPDRDCYFSPLKLLEGMAAGAAAVVPDLGDLAATVRHGEAGLVYDPSDPNALAESLLQLHSEPGLRAQLAGAGRRVAEEHSWVSIAADVLEVIGRER
jgi:glycosyltransferase involved in cell wall biosynthesis